ncbi:MAG: hypothetical protein EBZ48_15385 [Proteobacteria bacterium]|nr:hypothetical protein [Pseudomonadota bacterium]
MGLGAGILHPNDGEGNAQPEFLIEQDLEMIGPVFLKLHPAEEVNVGGVGVQVGEGEGNLGLGDRLILLGIIDEAFLDEVTASAAPACPEAEFEKADRQRRCRDGTDHADECLLAADLGADILAEDRGLKVG